METFEPIVDKIGYVYKDESIWDGVIKIRVDVYICFCNSPTILRFLGMQYREVRVGQVMMVMCIWMLMMA